MSKIKVEVYTKSNCVQCDMTKKQFNKFDIEYTEVNLEENLDKLEEFKAMGLMAAPIVVADGNAWSGFQPAHIDGLVRKIKSAERDPNGQ